MPVTRWAYLNDRIRFLKLHDRDNRIDINASMNYSIIIMLCNNRVNTGNWKKFFLLKMHFFVLQWPESRSLVWASLQGLNFVEKKLLHISGHWTITEPMDLILADRQTDMAEHLERCYTKCLKKVSKLFELRANGMYGLHLFFRFYTLFFV